MMILGRTDSKTDWRVIDIHCHVLPGLDDGAQDFSETVSMLRFAAAEGISDLVVTPHFHVGRYAPSPETVHQTLQQVQAAADAEQIPVQLHAGTEIYYFDEMLPYLQQQRVCTMNDSMCILVEFSPSIMFRSLQNVMNWVLNGGYQPILAHAERYACLLKDTGRIQLLHSMGVQIQINASTVMGKSGSEGKRLAHRLLRDNVVDYVATDAHGREHRRPEIARCRETIIKKYGADYARQILHENARKMLGL